MDIKQAYTRYFVQAPVLNRLILINIAFFLLFELLVIVGILFKTDLSLLKGWFSFPNDIFQYIQKPWTIITYGFLHSGFRHILYNMLFLYFFGQIFLNIHTGRRFLNLYFLGIIFGALFFMIAFAVFPLFSGIQSHMVGASAAVNAVMVAATIQSPNSPFKLMFIPITFKLWWLCVGLLIWDVIQLGSGTNAGGHFSHLGGAFIGYLYMIQLQKGNDLGTPVEKAMDWIVGLFKPKEKVRLKTVYRQNTKSQNRRTTSNKSQNPNQAIIDAILDKISKSGYESLSKKEKEILFKAGKG